VPGRIGSQKSASCASRVRRGSTTMSFAPLFFGGCNLRKAQERVTLRSCVPPHRQAPRPRAISGGEAPVSRVFDCNAGHIQMLFAPHRFGDPNRLKKASPILVVSAVGAVGEGESFRAVPAPRHR